MALLCLEMKKVVLCFGIFNEGGGCLLQMGG